MDLETLSGYTGEEILQLGKRKKLSNSFGGQTGTSGYTGVSFSSRRNKYRAFITFERVRYSLGYYVLLEDAVRRRLEAEIQYYGDILNEREKAKRPERNYIRRASGKNTRNINLVGKKLPHFVVTEYLGMKGKSHLWLCTCQCGNKFTATSSEINSGKISSCGCIKRKDRTSHDQTFFREIYIDDTSLAHISSKKEYKSNKTSGVRGVYKEAKTGYWCAKLTFQGIPHRIRCSTKKEAIRARKKLEATYFRPMVKKHDELIKRIKKRRKAKANKDKRQE